MVLFLFSGGLESGCTLLKCRLNVDDAKLAVLDFAMRCHGPKNSATIPRRPEPTG